jgi:DNA-binding beta-propeller fold protein YncE
VPWEIAFDAANNRVLVTDSGLSALMAVDLTSGERSIFADLEIGSGPPFTYVQGIAVDADNRRAFVADGDLEALFVVELGSGERAIASK